MNLAITKPEKNNDLDEFVQNFIRHRDESLSKNHTPIIAHDLKSNVIKLKTLITVSPSDPMHKARCKHSHHEENGQLLPVCSLHDKQLTCGPLMHVCLDCETKMSKPCFSCSAPVWRCCC